MVAIIPAAKPEKIMRHKAQRENRLAALREKKPYDELLYSRKDIKDIEEKGRIQFI